MSKLLPRLRSQFSNEDYEIIVNDDGSGEAADIVAIRVVDGTSKYIEADIFHCKFCKTWRHKCKCPSKKNSH